MCPPKAAIQIACSNNEIRTFALSVQSPLENHGREPYQSLDNCGKA
jgi:hypothetical protein